MNCCPSTSSTLAEYTFASPRSQKFSIPSNIIYYILKNPCSSKGYEILQKTCKYFFAHNPLIIVDKLKSWRVFRNDKKYEIRIRHHSSSQYFSIENFENILYKIWIVNEIFNSHGENISKLFQNIYRFDAKRVSIQYLNVSFDELLLFSSSPYLCKIWLDDVNIYHLDKSLVSVEEIFAIFPKLLDFYYYSKDDNPVPITADTVKILLQNPNFQKIKRFELNPISELFDFVKFSEFMKEKKQSNFELFFRSNLPENYKNQIQNYTLLTLKKIKEGKSFYPPLISFPGENPKIINEIHTSRYHYLKKHRFNY